MSDKEATLQLLETEYQNLRQAVDSLDAEQLSRVWFGTWSVRDIIAHILGWERETTGLLQRLARGERPLPEGIDYSNGDKGNARFALEMAPISPETVLAIWRQIHMNYVRAAKAVPADRFGEERTANLLLHRTAVDDFRQHTAGIRAWRQREGI